MKKILAIFVIIGLFCSISEAFGQVTFGEKPEQTTKVRIDETGMAHVIHEVVGNAKTTQQIETIPGTMSNLSVKDRNGNEVQYLTLEKYPIAIVLPPSNKDVILIQYDLADLVVLKNGIWTLEWTGLETTNFYFPKNVDIIWINDRPIYIGENGIRHHGGIMTLEYVLNEPVILKEASWEDKKFEVGIRTLTNVEKFEFNQPSKSITLENKESNPFFIIIIPLELLWEPYEVYVNNNKTLNSEFHNNGTHVWLGFRPDTSGTINIVGTTVVPEFPLFVPLVIGISLVLILQFRNKFNFR
ncbi:MAG TPA: hypothetical protein VLD38_02785 [Nitrosopumilaceae archaeon]|nr:hypothetical protein [Nitrosopumilaceae archaeon]